MYYENLSVLGKTKIFFGEFKWTDPFKKNYFHVCNLLKEYCFWSFGPFFYKNRLIFWNKKNIFFLENPQGLVLWNKYIFKNPIFLIFWKYIFLVLWRIFYVIWNNKYFFVKSTWSNPLKKNMFPKIYPFYNFENIYFLVLWPNFLRNPSGPLKTKKTYFFGKSTFVSWTNIFTQKLIEVIVSKNPIYWSFKKTSKKSTFESPWKIFPQKVAYL